MGKSSLIVILNFVLLSYGWGTHEEHFDEFDFIIYLTELFIILLGQKGFLKLSKRFQIFSHLPESDQAPFSNQ